LRLEQCPAGNYVIFNAATAQETINAGRHN
jgi:hypothetical protein